MFFASLRNLTNKCVSNSQLKEAKITVMSCVLKQNFHTLGVLQTHSETQIYMSRVPGGGLQKGTMAGRS